MTVEDIKILRAHLNLANPCDAAILYACVIMEFCCVTRLGEFMVPAITRFKSSKHITHHNVTFLRDQNNLPVMKCAHKEEVQCTPQTNCIINLEAALQNHFHVNPAPPNTYLFAYRDPKSSLWPLSKNQVTSRISAIKKLCVYWNSKGTACKLGEFYSASSRAFLRCCQSHGLLCGRSFHPLPQAPPYGSCTISSSWQESTWRFQLDHHAASLLSESPAPKFGFFKLCYGS